MVPMFKPKRSISNDDFIVVFTHFLTTALHQSERSLEFWTNESRGRAGVRECDATTPATGALARRSENSASARGEVSQQRN